MEGGSGGNSIRTLKQRERREALDGEAEYKKFLENERRVNDKSYPNGQEESSHVEVSKVMPPLNHNAAVEKHEEPIQSKVEKLHNNGELSENNDASWQMQLLQDVSNHYPHRSHHTKADSNYNANIEGRLNTKMSLASEQNAIHEIGLKYQHLRDNNELTADKDHVAENLLSEKQLLDVIESPSNNNFQQPQKWSSYDDDSSSPQLLHASDLKRSSTADQMQRRRFDDQTSKEKNELWDEIEDKLSKTEQLVPLHRVKRRDVINQSNRKDVNEIEMNEIGNNRFINVNVDDDDDDDDENDGDYDNFIENGEQGN